MTEQELVQKDNEQDDFQLKTSITRGDLTVIKGIGPSVAKTLNDANIISISDLAHSSAEQLARINGIGHSTAQKIIESAKVILNAKNLNGFTNNPDPVILEKNTDALVAKPHLLHSIHEVSDFIEEPEIVLEPEVYGVEDPEQVEDNADYEEFEDYEDEVEVIEEKIIPPEFNVAEEVVNQVTPVIVESQIEPKSISPSTFEHESNIEQKQLPVFTPKSHLGNEALPLEIFQQLENRVRKRLEEDGFYIIENNADLLDITSKIDMLAVKFVPTKNYEENSDNGHIDFLIIVPVRISNLKGHIIVSKDNLDYRAIEEENDFYVKRLPMSFIDALRTTEQAIRTNLLEDTTLRGVLNKDLNIKISLAKTITKKSLYFYLGNNQIEILIEPLVVSQSNVGFTEKVLPFAYHHTSNTHIIQLDNLSDYLEYLEKKYTSIQTCTENKTFLAMQCETGDKVLKGLKFGLSFTSFAFIYIIIFITQAYSLLSGVNYLGFGLFGIYSIIIGYLFLYYSKSIMQIKREFATPYHKRNFHLDNSRLKLINEKLTPVLMGQFSCEMLGRNPKFKVLEKIKRENSQNFISNKTLEKKVEETDLFEDEESVRENTPKPTSNVRKDLIDKYSSFLED